MQDAAAKLEKHKEQQEELLRQAKQMSQFRASHYVKKKT
jgi:hypothetical protein